MLLMRISSAGTCDWAIAVGGTGDDEGHDLVVATNGDVLVTGQFSGTVDFDPGAGAALLTSRGGLDGFVARYAADGSFLAVTQFGGSGDDAGNAIALRSDGDVIVGGVFTGIATFGSTAPVQLLQSIGGVDYFVARMTGDLNLEWTVRGGGAGDDAIGTGGVIAGADGLIYIAGTFSDVSNVGSGGPVLVSDGDVDVFVATLDATGAPAGLARSYGGVGTDGVSGFARDLAGNLYLSGSFQGLVDFDPGAGVHNVTALGTNGASDGYVLSLTPIGDFRWMNRIGAALSGDSTTVAAGIALSTDGSIWTVGQFFGLVDFDPGNSNVSRASVGDADQFIVRYDQTTGTIKR